MSGESTWHISVVIWNGDTSEVSIPILSPWHTLLQTSLNSIIEPRSWYFTARPAYSRPPDTPFSEMLLASDWEIHYVQNAVTWYHMAAPLTVITTTTVEVLSKPERPHVSASKSSQMSVGVHRTPFYRLFLGQALTNIILSACSADRTDFESLHSDILRIPSSIQHLLVGDITPLHDNLPDDESLIGSRLTDMACTWSTCPAQSVLAHLTT